MHRFGHGDQAEVDIPSLMTHNSFPSIILEHNDKTCSSLSITLGHNNDSNTPTWPGFFSLGEDQDTKSVKNLSFMATQVVGEHGGDIDSRSDHNGSDSGHWQCWHVISVIGWPWCQGDSQTLKEGIVVKPTKMFNFGVNCPLPLPSVDTGRIPPDGETL